MDTNYDQENIDRLRAVVKSFILSYPAEYQRCMLDVYFALCQFETYFLNKVLADDKCLTDELGYLIWEYNNVVGYRGPHVDPEFCGLVHLVYWYKKDVDWVKCEDVENNKFILKMIDPELYYMHSRVLARENCEIEDRVKTLKI